MLAKLAWPVPGGHMKELFSPGRREQGQFVGADVAGGRLPPVPRKVVVPPVPGAMLMIPPVPSVVLPRVSPPLPRAPALPPDPIGKVRIATLPPIPLLTCPGGSRSVRPHPADHAPPATKKRARPKPMYLKSLLGTAAAFFKRSVSWTSGQQGQVPAMTEVRPARAPQLRGGECQTVGEPVAVESVNYQNSEGTHSRSGLFPFRGQTRSWPRTC